MYKTIEKILLSNSVDEIRRLYEEVKELEIDSTALEKYLSKKVPEEKVLILATINNEKIGKKYEEIIRKQDYFMTTKYGFNVFHYIGIVENFWILPWLEKSEKINEVNSLGVPPIYMCENEKMIARMVANGANPNIKANLGQSLIFLKSSQDKSDEVSLLLDAGAHPNLMDSEGNTPLMVAAEYGCVKSVEVLLKYGANPNLLNEDNDGALNTAARKGYLEIVRTMIENGAIEVFGTQGNTALMEACHYGHYEITEYLLNTVSDANSVNVEGFTALMKAIEFNQLEIVKLLIKRGANLLTEDNKGWNTLSWAVSNYVNNKGKKSFEIIKFLIDEDFRIMGQNKNNKSPIFMSTLIDIFIKNDSYDFFSKRLEQVDVWQEEEEKLKTLYKVIDSNNLSVLRKRLVNSQEVNIKGFSNHTLLMHCLDSKKVDCFNLLIELGADIHCRSYRGYTVLAQLLKVKDIKIFKKLIKLGANIYEVDNNGFGILHFATQVNNLEAIKEALKLGLNIDGIANDGRTPLHLACLENNIELIKLLIKAGSNLELTDNKGNTPLFVALENGSDEVIEFLLDSGADFKKSNHENLDIIKLCKLKNKQKILKKISVLKIKKLDKALGL